MPNIREYTNPIEGLQPSDRATTSAVFAARHVESEYAQLGQSLGRGIAAAGDAYVGIKTQQDISHGLAASAQMLSNNTTSWNQTIANADPNDHTTGQKWMAETLEPQLQNYISSFSTDEGRKWAEQHAAELRQHFTEKTLADQAIQAGTAAVQNYHTTVQGLSTAALQDPASMNMSLGLLDKTVEAIIQGNPNLTAAQAAQMRGELRDSGREEIAKGAFIGSARANPDAAQADLQAGKYNGVFDATTQNQMFGFAGTIKRSQQEDAQAQQHAALEQDKRAATGEMASLYAAGVGKGPNGTWAPPQNYTQQLLDIVQRHPQSVDMGEIHSAQQMVATYNEDQANGRLVVSDPKTYDTFNSRTSIAQGQPGALSRAEIFQAVADRKLSQHDGQVLSESLDKSNDPAQRQLTEALHTFVASKKVLVMGQGGGLTGGGPDAGAEERYYQFQTAMKNAVDVGLSKGQTPEFIMQHQLNPASPDYLGNAQSTWMQYYHTGVLPPGAASNRPLPSPVASSVQPPAGQPAPGGTKLTQEQVNALIAGK